MRQTCSAVMWRSQNVGKGWQLCWHGEEETTPNELAGTKLMKLNNTTLHARKFRFLHEPVMRGMSMSFLPSLDEVTGNIAWMAGEGVRPQHNNSYLRSSFILLLRFMHLSWSHV